MGLNVIPKTYPLPEGRGDTEVVVLICWATSGSRLGICAAKVRTASSLFSRMLLISLSTCSLSPIVIAVFSSENLFPRIATALS